MNPFKLLNPNYLFDSMPGSTFLYFWPLFILFVLIFIASFWFHKKWPAYSLSGVPARMREFALLGLLFTFFRAEDVPYLGMRIWLVVLLIAGVVYGFERALAAQKEERLKDSIQEMQKNDHYRPKPKKGKKKKKR